MKRTLLIMILAVCAGTAFAQSYFTRVYHHDTSYTSGYLYGECQAPQPTADGGYLMVNNILQPGFDYYTAMSYVIKTDAGFRPQWCKPKADDNNVYSLGSGSLLYFGDLIGYDTPTVCEYGFNIGKLNLDGAQVFNERVCSDSFNLYVGPSVMPDVNLRIAGGCYRPTSLPGGAFIAIVDTNGAVLGADTFAINGTTGVIMKLFGDTSGNAYPAFRYISTNQFTVAKIKADRTVAWSWLISSDYTYEVSGMVALPNGDVIYGMTCLDWHDCSTRVIMVKFSASGDLLWQRRIDGLTRVNGMERSRNGNILLASSGTYFRLADPNDHPMLEIDTAARVLGAKNISPDTSAWPYYTGVSVPYESIEGDLYFSAVTMDTFASILFNTDQFGVGACASSDTFFTTTDTAFFSITTATVVPGAITLNTTIAPMDDTFKYGLAYTDICRGVTEKTTNTPTHVRVDIAPNPASYSISIVNAAAVRRLELYDMAGRLCRSVSNVEVGNAIYISCLRNGAYVARLYHKDGSVSNHKLVVLH